MDTIGTRIRHLRQQKGLSMDELAKLIQTPSKDTTILKPITSATVSNIENGKNNPSAEVIIALSDFFDVSTDWILKGREHHQNAKHKDASLTVKFTDNTIITIDQIIDLIDRTVTTKLNQIQFEENEKLIQNNDPK